MTVKVSFRAPSAEGINGKSEHKGWTYLTIDNEDKLNDAIQAALTDFVMKTGVNRDMVKITEEVEYD